jgi:hypothetical protein
MLNDVQFWQITVPLIAAVVAWLANEWRKRSWEDFLTFYAKRLTTSHF